MSFNEDYPFNQSENKYNYFPEGGCFPNPDPDFSKASFSFHYINPHPWLYSLRAMLQMLKGEIEIIHATTQSKISCDICNKAVESKNIYILSKLDNNILSKEML